MTHAIASYDAISQATPGQQLALSLEAAYALLNDRLWNGELPPLVLLVHRSLKTSTGGYYWPARWRERNGKPSAEKDMLAEIALNPGSWIGKTDAHILSVLAHEMAHHQQHVAGKPARKGYHNKTWGTEMKRIGLYPSNTGAPGGKETGVQMTHYVIAGGLFEGVCNELLAAGIKVRWESPSGKRAPKVAKKQSKAKYTCPCCDANAWAKPGTELVCGDCKVVMPTED